MQYEIRQYRPGDEIEILKTFNAVFAADHPEYSYRTVEQWRWEFIDNPAGNQIVLAVDHDQRVICQYCCLPLYVNLRGEKVVSGLGVDSFLDPSYRQGLKREGVFLRVARQYFKEIAVPEITAFGYGFPNDKAYRVGVKMLRYHEIRKPQITIYRNLWEVENDEDVGGKSTAGSLVEEVKVFDERFDRFWEQMIPHYPMARWRDAECLNWRYRGCSWIPYRTYAALDGTGELKGYCVVRPGWQDHPILAVPEIFTHPDDDGTFADLLRFITQLAREQEQLRIEFWFAETSKAYAMATGQGFKTEPSPFNLVGRFYRDDLDLDYARENWYYTLGDMDIL
ncbi:MAG: GNAT family N-acetyltransferase [Planctomycetes bacterium]|nr:GNAT family N-acetyltransferase [Planctomycetota bacterium]